MPKGCNACCKDYFAINEVEFAVIMDYLYNNCGIEKTNIIIKKLLHCLRSLKRTIQNTISSWKKISQGKI